MQIKRKFVRREDALLELERLGQVRIPELDLAFTFRVLRYQLVDVQKP